MNDIISGRTPRRRIEPPKDVDIVVKFMKSEADRIRNTPRGQNYEDNNTSVSNPFLSSSYPTKNIPDPLSFLPIETRENSNRFSLGEKLPSGVSWRYVNILDDPDFITKK